MRLAVIGAAGRIGSRIVTEARGRGHEVTAVIGDRSRLGGEPDRVVEADVFDPTAVAGAVAGTGRPAGQVGADGGSRSCTARITAPAGGGLVKVLGETGWLARPLFDRAQRRMR